MNEYEVYHPSLLNGIVTIRAHFYRTIEEQGVHSFVITELDDDEIMRNHVYWDFPIKDTVIHMTLKAKTKDDEETV